MTSMRAGNTPAKSAVGPSFRRSESRVLSVEGLRAGLGEGREEEGEGVCAVMRVLMTQIGFVIRTVALPARAPASIDSMVVSFCEARPARRAARDRRARVHSYPLG